jgi:hypothetical protein
MTSTVGQDRTFVAGAEFVQKQPFPGNEMKFRIEHIFHQQRPVSLFARQLEPGEFAVSERSRLGGVPIKPYLSQPRALTADGQPALTVFTFVLATANDLPRLQVGQDAELEDA